MYRNFQQLINIRRLITMQNNKIIDYVLYDKKLQSLFQFHRILGSGTFGVVYEVTNILQKRRSALKIELVNQKQSKFCNLKKQYDIIMKLDGIKNIPKVYQFQTGDVLAYLQIQLLCGDFRYMVLKENRIQSPQEIFDLGAKVLDILQKMHQRRIIHRDVKPQNLMYNKQKEVFIIDFGLSTILGQQQTSKCFLGTLRYASKNAHKFHKQSFKDDIQSLVYVLVHMFKHNLPWIKEEAQEGMQIYSNILKIKQKKFKQYSRSIPQSLVQILKYLEELKSNSVPDYDLIKKWILQAKLYTPKIRNSTLEMKVQTAEENIQIFNETNINTLSDQLGKLTVSAPKFMKNIAV